MLKDLKLIDWTNIINSENVEENYRNSIVKVQKMCRIVHLYKYLNKT